MNHDAAGVDRYVKQGKAMIEALERRRAVMRTKRFDTIAVHGVYDGQAAMENQG
jgi:hypothetical protein